MFEVLHKEVDEFIRGCYRELNKSEQDIDNRLKQIETELIHNGFYQHTIEELAHGAKMAWRNNNRCIGRLFWDQLTVIDKRDLNSEDEIIEALLEHIKNGTNNGRIRPTITIFSQQLKNKTIRIWNHQLLRYAGYQTEHGVLGDPDSIDFTTECMKLGWEPKYGHFDILPLMIQINDHTPKVFDIPTELLLEVPLQHPEYQWFEDLQLKWYAVPIISDMKLEIGGITYPAAPFNGWYMGTEIGARNLADEHRYDMLPKIADLMGIDTKNSLSLWKDKALVELNIAVLHSFREAGVTIVDHHTAAKQFKKFEEKEAENNRQVTGNWTWLIPPLSPATTHIFHKPYKNEIKKPNYFNQNAPY